MKNYLFGIALISILFACSNRSKPKSSSAGNLKPEAEKALPVQDNSADMVLFEGGTFLMGSENGDAMEKPVHRVDVKSFKLDKYPVTVAKFRQFVEATGYRTDADNFGDSGVFDFKTSGWALVSGANWEYPFGKNTSKAEDSFPVTQVSWNDANAYAAWAGKRLPTEAEWEFAARCGGKRNTRFSWGDKLIVDGKYMANVWQGDKISDKQGEDGFEFTSPVGSFGENSCGLTDMGGNVWNWCADVFVPYPGNPVSFQNNPDVKVIRGGSFFFDEKGEDSFSVTGRAGNTSETSLFNTGFRCAADVSTH